MEDGIPMQVFASRVGFYNLQQLHCQNNYTEDSDGKCYKWMNSAQGESHQELAESESD